MHDGDRGLGPTRPATSDEDAAGLLDRQVDAFAIGTERRSLAFRPRCNVSLRGID